jgi:hypothetical protein
VDERDTPMEASPSNVYILAVAKLVESEIGAARASAGRGLGPHSIDAYTEPG